MNGLYGLGCTPFWETEHWPCETPADVRAIKAEAAIRYCAARDAAREATGERWPPELAQIGNQYHVDVTTAYRRLAGSW